MVVSEGVEMGRFPAAKRRHSSNWSWFKVISILKNNYYRSSFHLTFPFELSVLLWPLKLCLYLNWKILTNNFRCPFLHIHIGDFKEWFSPHTHIEMHLLCILFTWKEFDSTCQWYVYISRVPCIYLS